MARRERAKQTQVTVRLTSEPRPHPGGEAVASPTRCAPVGNVGNGGGVSGGVSGDSRPAGLVALVSLLVVQVLPAACEEEQLERSLHTQFG